MDQKALFPLAKRVPSRVRNQIAGPLRTYEAASVSRRTVGWYPPQTSPNRNLIESLPLLRNRSRLAVRNDGYANGVIEKLVTNVVGTGIKPLSHATDPAFRRAAEGAFLNWTDEADADGLLDWYGVESLATRCWFEAGEVFIRIRDRLPKDGLSVPMQVQVIEPELCPLWYNALLPGGNRVRAGIEFDAIGRRAAYYFFYYRPGDLVDWNPGDLRRVPAESVIHLYKPKRAGQLRGIPHLTQALIRLHELDKFDDATLTRQQLAAMFVAFLTHPTSDKSSVLPVEEISLPRSGGAPTLGLQPGVFQELEIGEKVEFSDPPEPHGYVDFVRQQLRAVSAATGVPYEILTGDMSQVNDRTVRVILHEFRRSIQADQHHTVVYALCRPVWRAWMDRAVLAGAVPVDAVAYATDPTPWLAAEWIPQGWPYIQPVQDIQASEQAIRAGLTSRSAVVSEQGDSAEAIDAQQSEDNARADAAGLRYDSDGRFAPIPPPPLIPAQKAQGGETQADPGAGGY